MKKRIFSMALFLMFTLSSVLLSGCELPFGEKGFEGTYQLTHIEISTIIDGVENTQLYDVSVLQNLDVALDFSVIVFNGETANIMVGKDDVVNSRRDNMEVHYDEESYIIDLGEHGETSSHDLFIGVIETSSFYRFLFDRSISGSGYDIEKGYSIDRLYSYYIDDDEFINMVYGSSLNGIPSSGKLLYTRVVE